MLSVIRKLPSVVCLLSLLSCTTGNKHLSESPEFWLGREIMFPADMPFQVQGSAVDYDVDDCDYKILCYVDSIGCSVCSMNMPGWELFLSQVVSNPDISVKFIMAVNTDNEAEIIRKARQYRFNYPIVIDKRNAIDSLNHFPSDIRSQTFLLDEYNRVIVVGNPLFDPEIMKEYNRLLSNAKCRENQRVIAVKPEHIAMGIFQAGEEKKTRFRLRNTSREPISIDEISTSCSCTSAWADQYSIQAGLFLDVYVSCRPESGVGYFQQFVYLTFNNKEVVTLSISGFNGIEKRQRE